MSHRYRLYPTPEQEAVMRQHCAHSRFVWNLALEQKSLYRRAFGPTPGYAEQSRQLTEARRASDWLWAGSRAVQTQALNDFHKAWNLWHTNPRFHRPTWRRRIANESFRFHEFTVLKLNRKWADVTVPRAGRVKFRLARPLPDKFGMGRVKMDRAGRWFVSFGVAQPPFERQQTRRKVGVDMGVVNTATLSTGAHLNMPRALSAAERARKDRLHRRLGRQEKGSNRYERTRRQHAKLSARQSRRRRDWLEQTTTRLVRGFDLIALEELNAERMSQGPARSRNRGIQQSNWATFRRRIEEKATAATTPCQVVIVNPAYTSVSCNKCGHIAEESRKRTISSLRMSSGCRRPQPHTTASSPAQSRPFGHVWAYRRNRTGRDVNGRQG